jgi:hypothetical protein
MTDLALLSFVMITIAISTYGQADLSKISKNYIHINLRAVVWEQR